MTNKEKPQINPEHPRIKNRDPREQKFRDEIVKTLNEGKVSLNKRYDEDGRLERPTRQKRWISEVNRDYHLTDNHLEYRLHLSRLLDNKSGFSFEDKILSVCDKWNIKKLLGQGPTNKLAFALIEKGKLRDVVANISNFVGLTAEDCENIASKMLRENVFSLVDHLHKFPIITQKMVDEGIANEYIAPQIVRNMEVYKKQGFDPKSIALKLVETQHHYLVAAYFKKFGGRDLGLDIIYKVLSTPDDGSIVKHLPNIISEESLSKLPPALFSDNKFVALLLSVSPNLYDKIDNPNKAFIKKVIGKLKGENIGSMDMDAKNGVVSYIRGTSRDTGAGMEYGNYVKAAYNGEEKQIHEVYRDGYNPNKDNRNLNYNKTNIKSVKVDGENIIVMIKAISERKNYSRDYTFTFEKAKNTETDILTIEQQEKFLDLVKEVKKQIIENCPFRREKNDWVSTNPSFKSEKINAEKGTAIIALFKQIDYSTNAGEGHQYAYEVIKIFKDGSHKILDYKAARDYERRNGLNIVLDANDYDINS